MLYSQPSDSRRTQMPDVNVTNYIIEAALRNGRGRLHSTRTAVDSLVNMRCNVTKGLALGT